MTSSGTYIIAEIGVNHNGSVELATDMIVAAAAAGADAVKFQTFNAADLVAKHAVKAEYQKRDDDPDESQLQMLSRLQLPEADYAQIVSAADKAGVDFLSSSFDHDSLIFLIESLGLATIKFASGELTNLPLLLEAGRRADHLILSTGMSTLKEVRLALSVVAFAKLTPDGLPDGEKFRKAYECAEGQLILSRSVTLLHCTSQYPAPIDQVNLRAMSEMERVFNVAVGYSDHTDGIEVAVAAVARGATMLEKHFTLNRGLPGPDHKASLEPDQFEAMVNQIRIVERALGSNRKEPQRTEMELRKVARKSLVALKTIKLGEPLSVENLGVKRPGDGISPSRYWEFLGHIACRDYQPDDHIEE